MAAIASEEIAMIDNVHNARRQTHWVAGIAACYVAVWISEGAIRKWVPGTDLVLYILRDALLLLALAAVWLSSAKKLRSTTFIWLIVVSVTIWSLMYGFAPGSSIVVVALGLRSFIAPLLLFAVAWAYGDFGAVRAILRTIAAFIPVQAAIAIWQTASPATSVINREVSSDSASFVLDGVVRASGTFSSPSGLTAYVTLAAVAAFIVSLRRAWMRGALLALVLVTVGVSGARGSVLAVGVVCLAFTYKSLADGGTEAVKRVSLILLLLGASAIILWNAFPVVVDTFALRFEQASQSEDSADRLLTQTFGFLGYDVTLLGNGAGSHSQAGISAGSGVEWIEIDSVRWVAELGVLGLALALLRLLIGGVLGLLALVHVRAWPLEAVLFASALCPVLLFGAVSQNPSSQGFTSICASGLALSLHHHSQKKFDASLPDVATYGETR